MDPEDSYGSSYKVILSQNIPYSQISSKTIHMIFYSVKDESKFSYVIAEPMLFIQ